MTSIYRKGILLEKIMKHLKMTKLKRYSLQQFRLSCGLCALTTHLHQSRVCGKGVGSGLFPSDSLQSEIYEFIEIAQIDHTTV